MASLTLCIFSASSSGISMLNSSSNRITNSTVSSESAPRSSMNLAFGVTSDSSTPSSSTMICLTLSSIDSAMSSSEKIWVFGADVKCLKSEIEDQDAVSDNSSHIHSAINVNHLTGDIACLIRGQKCNRVGDIHVGSGPLEWNLFEHRVARRYVQGRSHRRLDESGRDGVDRDVARSVFARHSLGESNDPRFRRN